MQHSHLLTKDDLASGLGILNFTQPERSTRSMFTRLAQPSVTARRKVLS